MVFALAITGLFMSFAASVWSTRQIAAADRLAAA